MSSKSFGSMIPQVPHLSKGEVADLRNDVEVGFTTNEAYIENGSYARANLKLATLPTATDTVTIGADVYEFGGVGANINVAIGASVAASRTNLAAAINASGTSKVFAAVSTVPTAGVSIVYADVAGGTPVKGPSASYALSDTLTAAGDGWDQDNLNALGVAEGTTKKAEGKVVIGTNNLAFAFAISLGFTPTKVIWTAYAATGAPKTTTATVAISGNYLVVTAAAGATPLVATDYIMWKAIE